MTPVERMDGMTTRTTLALVAALLIGSALPAQDDEAKKKTAEMMAAYAKFSQPGPQHKLLEPLAGKWAYTAKFWMVPSAPAMEMKGTSEGKWILGGRFLVDDVDSSGFAGQPFKGLGLMGYDNIQQKYTSVWIDSMTTGFTMSTGTVDASGKVFTYHKEEVDPLTKQKFKGRDVIKIESNDRHVMEMYKIMDGKELKMMEIVYTRK